MKLWDTSKKRRRQQLEIGGSRKFYRIVVRPKRQFDLFRTHDVGKRGGLERITGRRPNGNWDTQAWLISKEDAHMNDEKKLIMVEASARLVHKSLSGSIKHIKGDTFKARPRRSVNKHKGFWQVWRRTQ
jgi:hypothetical protein